MNLRKYFAIGAVVLISSQVLFVYAHHSDTPHFFMDQNVIYEGVVTDFKFVNPHVYVYFDMAIENGGNEAWRCELPAAITLRRQGWSPESLTNGQLIRIDGSPARREARHCYFNAFVLDDGSVVERADAGPDTKTRFGDGKIFDSTSVSTSEPRYVGKPATHAGKYGNSGGSR